MEVSALWAKRSTATRLWTLPRLFLVLIRARMMDHLEVGSSNVLQVRIPAT